MTAEKLKTVHKIEYWMIVVWLTAVLSAVIASFLEARWLTPLSPYLDANNVISEVSFDPADDVFEGRQVVEYSAGEISEAKDITAQGRVRWTFSNPFYGGKCMGLMFTIVGEGAVDRTITIRLQDENKTDINRLYVAGQSGEVYLDFPYSNVKRIRIIMDKPDDGTAEIVSLRFIEGEQVSLKEIGKLSVPMFVILIAGVFAVYRIGKKRWKAPQRNRHEYRVSIRGLSDGKVTRVFRCLLFLFIFIMGYIGVSLKIWSGSVYCIAMCALLCMVIALLCGENGLYFLLPQNLPLTWLYVGYSGLVLLSELIVRKRIGGAGLLLFVVLPFFVMQWRKMNRPGRLLADLAVAAVLTVILLCLIRPYFENGINGIYEVIDGAKLYSDDLKGVIKRLWNTLSPWGHSSGFEYFGGRVSLPFGFSDVLYQYGVFAFALYVPLRIIAFGKGIIICFQKGISRIIGILFLIMNVWSAFLLSFEVPCANWQWIVFYMTLLFIIFSERMNGEKLEN